MPEPPVEPPAMDVEIDDDRDVNRLTLRGAFDLESLKARLATIQNHSDYREGRHYLVDAREATFAPMTLAQVDSLDAFIENE